MKKVKITEIEYLRGFAFLAVVLQHSIGHYVFEAQNSLSEGITMAVFLLVSKFAVPMFIFITGLVLFYNYEGKIHYGAFIFKRCKDILLPYLLWVLLYADLFNGLSFSAWSEIWRFITLAFTGKAMYHLWYIVMIFQFYLVFPHLQIVITWLNRTIGKYRIPLLIALGILYIWLTSLKSVFFQAFGNHHIIFVSDFFTTYMDRNAIFFFFYFILGAAAGLHLEQWRIWIIRNYYAIVIAYFSISIYMFYVILSHIQLNPKLLVTYSDTLLIRPLMSAFLIISVLAMHAIAINFSLFAPGIFRRFVLLAGSYSYIAYLAHPLILRYTTKTVDWFAASWSPNIQMLLSFVFCASCSVGLAILFRNSRKLWTRTNVGTIKLSQP